MEVKKKMGKFIVFEGIDGAGKSTVVAMVVKRLQERGEDVFVNEEPTDGPFGRAIREILQGSFIEPALITELEAAIAKEAEGAEDKQKRFWAEINMAVQNLEFASKQNWSGPKLKNLLTPLQEQSLFFADRYLDLKERIIPALAEGKWIVNNRYELSVAYGVAKGMKPVSIYELRESALGPFYRKPDLTFYLQVPAELAVERLEKRGKKLDRNETLENLKKVSKAYDQLIDFLNFNKEGYEVVYLDGAEIEEEVFGRIIHYLEKFFTPSQA